MRKTNLKHLGVPRYISTGIFEHKGSEYRFLIMDRYSKDLQVLLNENNHHLNENFVLNLTSQILYSLEYIHLKGYAHADIKGSNLMMKTEREVVLIDYGLAHKLKLNNVYFPKHNGTIEYTSRDAHAGRRNIFHI